jgi:hypothetical protein
MPELIHLLKM